MNKVDKQTVFRAIREKIASEGHSDPTPWVDGKALVELWGGTEAQHKLDAATKIAFLSGLLNGAIVAIAEVDGKWLAVPGWYWARANQDTLWSSWPERLPIEWEPWRGIQPEWFDADLLNSYLAKFSWIPSPDLPAAHDESGRPQPEGRRPLPSTGMVTLSEAVSWVAWNFALPGSQLCNAIDFDEFGLEGTDSLMAALDAVLAAGKAGQLVAFGKFKPYGAEHGLTRPIEPYEMLDFARFNPEYDALERGRGWSFDDTPLDQLFSGGDSFVEVHVRRDEVLALYSDMSTVGGHAEVADMPTSWRGKAITMRKRHLDEMARALRNGEAKSRYDAALKAISSMGFDGTGCANFEAARKRIYEDYPKLYSDDGLPLRPVTGNFRHSPEMSGSDR